MTRGKCVHFVGGPLDGETRMVQAGVYQLDVMEPAEPFVAFDPGPPTKEKCHVGVVTYHITMINQEESSPLGFHCLLRTAWIGVLSNDVHPKMPSFDFECEFIVKKPDFIDEFDRWMQFQKFRFCPWTWEHHLENNWIRMTLKDYSNTCILDS